MRLFIAINFSGEVKQKLVEIQEGFRINSLRGNFSTYENLHLTLVFLGEVAGNRIAAVRKAMDNAEFSPFRLNIRGVGSFSRDGGDILWAGIDADRNLTGLQSRLCSQIALTGFEVEKRSFKPHLTLAREVRLYPDFDRAAFSRGVGAISTEVSKISLMKSERLGGKLTYTEIYSVSGKSEL